ncbi:MAG: RSP_7527 family protein [Pikeienuella sp.]
MTPRTRPYYTSISDQADAAAITQAEIRAAAAIASRMRAEYMADGFARLVHALSRPFARRAADAEFAQTGARACPDADQEQRLTGRARVESAA